MFLPVARAKRKDTGTWESGYYVQLYYDAGRQSHRIYTGYAESEPGEAGDRDFYPEWFEVDPATVSLFSGASDKRGVKIFEGDIVLFDYLMQSPVCSVRWDDSICQMVLQDAKGKEYNLLREIQPGPAPMESRYEIIGNIFDNPDLLGGEKP